MASHVLPEPALPSHTLTILLPGSQITDHQVIFEWTVRTGVGPMCAKEIHQESPQVNMSDCQNDRTINKEIKSNSSPPPLQPPVSARISSLVNYLQVDGSTCHKWEWEKCYICSLLVFNPTLHLLPTLQFSFTNMSILAKKTKQFSTLASVNTLSWYFRQILLIDSEIKQRILMPSEGSFPMKLIFKFILERWYQGQGC